MRFGFTNSVLYNTKHNDLDNSQIGNSRIENTRKIKKKVHILPSALILCPRESSSLSPFSAPNPAKTSSSVFFTALALMNLPRITDADCRDFTLL